MLVEALSDRREQRRLVRRGYCVRRMATYTNSTSAVAWPEGPAEKSPPRDLVLHDLLAWRDARLEGAEVCYWRTSIGEEVDFVIEAEGSLLPIEVKAGGASGSGT